MIQVYIIIHNNVVYMYMYVYYGLKDQIHMNVIVLFAISSAWLINED